MILIGKAEKSEVAVVDRSVMALARKELAGWRQFGGDGGGKAKQLLAMFEVLDPPLACALYFLQSCELPLFRFCLVGVHSDELLFGLQDLGSLPKHQGECLVWKRFSYLATSVVQCEYGRRPQVFQCMGWKRRRRSE